MKEIIINNIKNQANQVSYSEAIDLVKNNKFNFDRVILHDCDKITLDFLHLLSQKFLLNTDIILITQKSNIDNCLYFTMGITEIKNNY